MKGLAFGAGIGLMMAVAAAACGGGSSGGNAQPGDAGGGADQQNPHPESGTPEGSAESGGGTDGGNESGPTDGGGTKDVVDESAPFVTAPHPAWPVVSANNGVVLHNMKLVIVAASGDTLGSDYFAYGDNLIGSTWWQSFAPEYGLGTPSACVHVTGPAITANPNGADMENYIQQAIAGTPAAAPDGDTMYMLYLPTGIDIINDQTSQPNTNCQYYGGYHTRLDQSGDAWGVVQHCPTQGTGFNDLQWMEVASSHEIAEAATDPQPTNGYAAATTINRQAPWTQTPWIIAVDGEVGDLCVETQLVHEYQRIWSANAAAKGLDPCVPAYTQYAYVNASAPQGWYTVTAGSSVQIPVTGWSDKATEDWLIFGQVWNQSLSTNPGFTANVTSPTSLAADAGGYPTTNNGRTSTLVVTAPKGAPSGSWASVALISEPQIYSGDPYHLWFVGVYVQ